MVPSKLYWLARYWNDLLQTHPNQWVALDDSGQLFAGDSRHEARQQAVCAGCIKPLTVYIAEDAWGDWKRQLARKRDYLYTEQGLNFDTSSVVKRRDI